MPDIQTNNYTEAEFVRLFRFRIICAALKSKAASDLTTKKIKKAFSEKKENGICQFHFKKVWESLNDLFEALGLDTLTEHDFDLAGTCLFSGKPVTKNDGDTASFSLSKKEIKYFHRNCRFLKANATETRALDLGEVIDFEDEDFAF